MCEVSRHAASTTRTTLSGMTTLPKAERPPAAAAPKNMKQVTLSFVVLWQDAAGGCSGTATEEGVDGGEEILPGSPREVGLADALVGV